MALCPQILACCLSIRTAQDIFNKYYYSYEELTIFVYLLFSRSHMYYLTSFSPKLQEQTVVCY